MILIILFTILAGIAEGIMDLLNFKYDNSIFKKYNPNFWNKDISYLNKYKGSKLRQFFFKTVFVMFTDAWHLFKSLHTFMLFGMLIFIYLMSTNIWNFIIIFVIAYSFKKLVFEISYKYFQT